MTEFYKFIVTLPADEMGPLEKAIHLETVLGDVKRPAWQIAAALALACHKQNASRTSISTYLPGLIAVCLDDDNEKPDPLDGLDSLSFRVLPPDAISVQCNLCDHKSGGNTVQGQGVRLAIKTMLEHVEKKHG